MGTTLSRGSTFHSRSRPERGENSTAYASPLVSSATLDTERRPVAALAAHRLAQAFAVRVVPWHALLGPEEPFVLVDSGESGPAHLQPLPAVVVLLVVALALAGRARGSVVGAERALRL